MKAAELVQGGLVVQFGKISLGVYPEHGRRIRDDHVRYLFVISGIMAKKCCIFSPRGEMQEPTEISIAVSACETTMLSVALFQSREITFEGIGGFRNRRVVKIVKHVRQSTEEHAARSFEITKNPPSFR